MIPNDINILNNEGKVSFYTYNCTKKEIDSVNNLQFFHNNGEIKDIPKDFNNKKEIVLLNYEENKYNYKTYKFLFDKIIIIDIYAFLIEFINEIYEESIEKIQTFIKNKINTIALFNNFILLKFKVIPERKINEGNPIIYFKISNNIKKEEYEILTIILKKYLNANVLDDKSRELVKSNSQNYQINNKIYKNINLSENKIEKKVYLIVDKRENTLNNFIDKKNFNNIIISKFVYDCFIFGKLIDITQVENLSKYKI